MNKHAIGELYQYIENESQYRMLLQERHISEDHYATLLEKLELGLQLLGISNDVLGIFKDRSHFIIFPPE